MDALISDLYSFNTCVAIRDDTENRILMNSIPKLGRGVVIHQRVLTNNRLIYMYIIDN